jgi:Leucine-rich repeat (LRR) protein|tara:strand:+ start:306 stop:641 length:336 start_codon:yes stop_codon:yes gene_type:complete
LNTSIEALDLSNTKLDKIPAEIAQYPQLKVLLLDINSISEMKGIEGLIKLEHLNLSENELPEIEGLEKLSALQKWLFDNFCIYDQPLRKNYFRNLYLKDLDLFRHIINSEF